MPSEACIRTRQRALLVPDCVMQDGSHQKRCCDCDHRDKPVCDIMAGLIPGMQQCSDCSFPRV